MDNSRQITKEAKTVALNSSPTHRATGSRPAAAAGASLRAAARHASGGSTGVLVRVRFRWSRLAAIRTASPVCGSSHLPPRPSRPCSARHLLPRPAPATNAFSKKLENHAAMVAIYFRYSNFARVHQTPRNTGKGS